MKLVSDLVGCDSGCDEDWNYWEVQRNIQYSKECFPFQNGLPVYTILDNVPIIIMRC